LGFHALIAAFAADELAVVVAAAILLLEPKSD
jgi:hypothetical protein